MKRPHFVKNNKLYLGAGKQKGGGLGLLSLGLSAVPILSKLFGGKRKRKRRRRKRRRW